MRRLRRVTTEPSPTLAAVTRLFPRRLIQWIGPLVAVTMILGFVAIIVASTGLLAFPASSPDPAGMEKLIHASFQRSVAEHSDDIPAPADLGAAWRVQLGAGHFARSCAACHGEPGRGQNPIALSMRPRPQYLPAVENRYTPSQLFWIVKHGVKFAGMPAWPNQTRDDEIWSVVAFLRQAKGMDARQFADLAYGPAVAAKVPESFATLPYTENNAGEQPVGDFRYVWPAAALRSNGAGGGAGCEGCHGTTGTGRPGGAAPNLTLQDPRYLDAALQSFASGRRTSAVMQNIAASMSRQDMADAARFYGGKMQAGPDRTASAVADPAGEAIALRGIPARSIAACASCHGIEGASRDGFPVIAGQNSRFLRQQMDLFRKGVRGKTVGYDPMSGEAHSLTDGEIAAVSDYYAFLAPGARPVAKLAAAH